MLRPSYTRTGWFTALLLTAILLVAAAVRLCNLAVSPPGLWFDEAIYALDGWSIGAGNWPLFFTTMGRPREPLYMYSLAGTFAFLGPTIVAARITSALWGIAAVAIMFPVARRIVGRRWAFAACFVLATLCWHVHFSRTIFRATMPPFFVLLLVWTGMRWLERRRPMDAVLAGAALGLGMYTYLSFRLVPLMLAAWLLALALRGRVTRRDTKSLAVAIVAAIVVFAPLLADWVKNPWHFSGRTNEISVLKRAVPGSTTEPPEQQFRPIGDIAGDVATNVGLVASMWAWNGDPEPKHNIPGRPVFDPLCAAIFFVGLAWALWRIRRPQHALLLAWLGTFAITNLFSYGSPNTLRMNGASPAVALIFTLGLRQVWIWTRGLTKSPVLRTAPFLLILGAFPVAQLVPYFIKYHTDSRVAMVYHRDNFTAIGHTVADLAKQNATFFVSEDVADHPTFQYLVIGVPNIRRLPFGDELTSTTVSPAPTYVLVTPHWLSRGTERQRRAAGQTLALMSPMREFLMQVPEPPRTDAAPPSRFPVGMLFRARTP